MKLVVGLGNPGNEYRFTRHNAGFWAVDVFLTRKSKTFSSKSGNCHSVSIESVGKSVWLVQPQTFMNLSGDAVVPFMRKKGISPEDTLIVHDEADLLPGRIQLKFGGGTGGHNGLESIVERLGSKDFWRIRIGVGKSGDKDLADHVLEPAPESEARALGDHGADAIEMVLLDGPKNALNRINAPTFQRVDPLHVG